MYNNFAQLPDRMQALFVQHYPAPIQQAIEENILYIEDARTYFKDNLQKIIATMKIGQWII